MHPLNGAATFCPMPHSWRTLRQTVSLVAGQTLDVTLGFE
jgi:hypothetical protein